jgi:hypothetical protein
VAKAWTVPIQKALFRRIELGRDGVLMKRDGARLRFVAKRLDLAIHVTEVERFEYVLPPMQMHKLLRKLPCVYSVAVHISPARPLRAEMPILIRTFPRLHHLSLFGYNQTRGGTGVGEALRRMSFLGTA